MRAEEKGGKIRAENHRMKEQPGLEQGQVLFGDKVGGQRVWLTRWVPEMSSGELPVLSGSRPTSPPRCSHQAWARLQQPLRGACPPMGRANTPGQERVVGFYPTGFLG